MPLTASLKNLISLLIALDLSLLINLTVKVKMVKKLLGERELLSTQSKKRLLNSNLFLNFKEIQSYLSFSKDIDVLHNSKSVGQCTSNSCFPRM